MEKINEIEPGASVLKQLHLLQTEGNQISAGSRWFGISPLQNADVKAWYQGYVGELETANALAKLTLDGWQVYHSVPVGKKGSDIDHVVISPENVIFVINSKHHKNQKIWVSEKQVRVSGQVQPYIRNSLYESTRISKKTGTVVVPVITFVNASGIDIKPGAEKNTILITTPSNLVSKLKKANKDQIPQILPDNVSNVEWWAEKYEDHTEGHEQRVAWFENIHKHEQVAQTMRPVYGLAGVGAVIGGILLFMPL